MTSPLGRIIGEIIATEGPISLSRYMALALGHPQHGYYQSRDPFGRGGDFVTAPEISQIFGELIGLWAAHAHARDGAPKRVALVELGPGRGTLMRDALRAIARAAPAFHAALSLHLVETSAILRAIQAETLAHASPTWHDRVETLPDGPLIVIANEFFDALPIRQFLRRDGAWRERLVGLDQHSAHEARLAFGISAEPVAVAGLPGAPAGAMLEICEAAAAIMGALARRIAREGGAGLVIDYGHLESGFGDTLQAVRAHRSADPLADPGEADLTAHVDFAALGRVAMAEGAAVDLMTSQAAFLAALGIEARAAALRRTASPAEAAAIDAALVRLTDTAPTGMGALFKVLAIARQEAA